MPCPTTPFFTTSFQVTIAITTSPPLSLSLLSLFSFFLWVQRRERFKSEATRGYQSMGLEAALSCGQSQLLKSMRELAANSSKVGLDDGFGPQAMTNLMSTKPNKASKWNYQGVAENHDKQFATSVLAPQFYSHCKHYCPLLLTFLTLHNPLFSYKI
ncbi:hypothetical protein NC652_010532 [Populus alba x Populus x berolinensis]|nr:hypothetical protein NC652_010532 [Populus alba x Populus x berolinensis]